MDQTLSFVHNVGVNRGQIDLLQIDGLGSCIGQAVIALPDYQPVSDQCRYPRENVRRCGKEEQAFGQAWAHRFLIRGNANGGAMAGKVVSVKDAIAVAGVPQLIRSDTSQAWTPTTDATVVTRLLNAGADIHGTLTCENYYHSTSLYTSAQGTVENPHKAGYSAGDSTSGGAALVAAGLVDIAIGDNQGEIFKYLQLCIGLKPTHGRVPFTGISSEYALVDHAGPLARTTLEAALCLDVISGYDGIDDRSLGSPIPGSMRFAAAIQEGSGRLDGFKICIMKEGFEHVAVDPRAKTSVMTAARKLESLGASIEEISLPEHLHGPAVWTILSWIAGAQTLLGHNTGRRGLCMTEAEHNRLPWTNEGLQRAFPSTKNVIINGLYQMARFPNLYGKTQSLFTKYDALILPTAPIVAPKHGKRGLPLESLQPSIGLTINTADDAQLMLPVGMQIVGLLWQENILQVGHA
ncbi:amidase signature domain-containing protein [Aspergillus aurantiobrunneus]